MISPCSSRFLRVRSPRRLPEQTEGEQLVSQSIQLLKEMQEKQAKTNQSFNKTADHYQMSLERLDKEIQLHQKHLDEAEQQDYSEWNKHVAPSPDKKGAEEPSFRAGAVKSHIKGKSLLELFHYYDQDDSGTVNKGELICILSDLGVLDGLSPDDALEGSWTTHTAKLMTMVMEASTTKSSPCS